MEYWRGKIAVVTGASAGIGARVALDLAQAGLEVVALARRLERLEALASEAAKFPGTIHPVQCDVSSVDSIEAAFRGITQKFGKINVLINNAGLAKNGGLFESKVAHRDILQVINVNLSAAVVCTREAFKLMESHSELAYIINVNSVVGHSSPNFSLSGQSNVYAATKHGLTNHTEFLRLHMAHSEHAQRIRVTSLSPGVVKTEIFEAAGFSPEERHYNNLPHLEDKNISDAVLYLLALPQNVNVSELTIRPVGEKF